MKPLFLLVILLMQTGTSSILELRLDLNFGEVFHDFSGSSNFCENGRSSEDLAGNTKLSKWGAFFSSTEDSLITLPSNKVQPRKVQFPSSFTEVFWIRPTSTESYQTLLLKGSNYFDFSLVLNQSRLAIITNRPFSGVSSESYYSKALKLTQNWNLITLQYSESSVVLDVSFETMVKVPLLDAIRDFPRVSLGAAENSIKGFIYRFLIVSEYRPLDAFSFSSQIIVSSPEYIENLCNACGLTCGLDQCFQCSCQTCLIIEGVSRCAAQGFFQGCAKSQFYASGLGCFDCDSDCEECLDHGKCTKCKDKALLLDSQGKCVCQSGKFLKTDSFQEKKCFSCSHGCENCERFDKCLVCKTGFSLSHSFNSSTCVTSRLLQPCAEGFYLDSTGDCQRCHESCLNCLNFTTCLECSVKNSIPVGAVCECQPGFFKEIQAKDFECLTCSTNCSTCSNNVSCTSCTTQYSNLVDGVCECPENSFESQTVCVPIAGYFMTRNQTSNTTAKCHQSCKSCRSSSANSCIECINNLKKQDDLCSSCEKGSFYDSFKCYDCAEDCLECKNLQICLKCKNQSLELVQGLCLMTCPKGFFSADSRCVKCASLCEECVESQCLACKPDSFLYNGECKCSPGFIKELDKCVDRFFSAKLTEFRGILKLSFSEQVVSNLTMKEILITINEKKAHNSVLLKSSQFKEFLIYVPDAKGENHRKISLFIENTTLFSKEDSKLKDYVFSTNSSLVDEADNQMFFESVNTLIQVLAVFLFGVGFCTSFSLLWTLIYFTQIISYSSLTGNQMTADLKLFMRRLNEFNILPNIFDYLFERDSCSLPGVIERQSGFESSVFFLNIGSSFMVFVAGLVFWLFCFGLCVTEENDFYKTLKKIKDMLKNQFLLRSLTLLYLDLGINGIIQYKSVIFTQQIKNPVPCYINMISGYIAIVILNQILVFLTVPAILTFMIVSRERINNLNQDFLKSWSFFFEEFSSNKGILSFQFYLIFFIRRLVFIISHMLLNDYLLIQGAANILFSLICLGYLLYFRPFTDVYLMVSNIFLEAVYLIVCIFCYSLLWDLDRGSKNVVEIFVFCLSFLAIFFVFVACFVKFCMKVFKWGTKLIDMSKNYNEPANRVGSGVSFVTFEANTLRNI